MTTEAKKPDSTLDDLRFVIDNAQVIELRKRPTDTTPKSDRKGQPVSVQGLVLDAMDDGRVSMIEAHRLLCELQSRLHDGAPGMSRILPDGTLQPIGTGATAEASQVARPQAVEDVAIWEASTPDEAGGRPANGLKLVAR